jgi:hypothetical protein
MAVSAAQNAVQAGLSKGVDKLTSKKEGQADCGCK